MVVIQRKSIDIEPPLVHHGIKGQKWGVRRFQNQDGSLTVLGKKRYESDQANKQTYGDKRKAKLMSQGLTEEQAKSQIDFEKRAAIVAGVCAAAIGASCVYGLVRAHNGDNDIVLDAGAELFRVASSDTQQMGNMFYAATNKLDATKYAGLYAVQKKMSDPTADIYQKVLSPNSAIKVAGNKTGKKVFDELCKNDAAFKKAFGADGYDMFNQNIVVDKNSGQTKKFFDSLQQKGYGGIMDINDIKYSGYESNKPVIFFNQQNNVSVNSVKKLNSSEIKRNAAIGTAAVVAQGFMRSPLTVAQLAVPAGMMYLNSYVKKQDKKNDNKRK